MNTNKNKDLIIEDMKDTVCTILNRIGADGGAIETDVDEDRPYDEDVYVTGDYFIGYIDEGRGERLDNVYYINVELIKYTDGTYGLSVYTTAGGVVHEYLVGSRLCNRWFYSLENMLFWLENEMEYAWMKNRVMDGYKHLQNKRKAA